MVEFKTAYYTPMDRTYVGNFPNESNHERDIEKPLFPVNEIGQTVTEGRQFGSLINTATAAIRAGAGRIELQTQMGGGPEALGAESYGKDARQTLRELAKANQIMFTSVHTPTNIANLSGFNPQRGSFEDEFRKLGIEEVKSAIKFAAEATQGGAVVVHTGEYQRPIFDAPWNKGQFVAYDEEPASAVKPLVDNRTGRVLTEVRLNQEVAQAVWNKYEPGSEEWQKHDGKPYVDERGNIVEPGDYIDYEGNKVNRNERVPKFDKEKGTFVVVRKGWQDFVKDAEEMNKEKERELGRPLKEEEKITPEEAFLIATTETQEKISRGWAGNYSEGVKEIMEDIKKLKQAKKYYENLEKSMPKEELWKIMERDPALKGISSGSILQKYVGSGKWRKPSEIIEENIQNMRKNLEDRREMVTGQLQSAEEQKILREHALSASKYALNRTFNSYAELGIEAMKQSHHNPYVKKDIFVAPENIFPEMGYGSHPEELIELVKKSRERMVDFLTKPKIPDPSGRVDENGNPIMINNPYYTGMSREEAEREAKEHIKATLDTQHLGMWYRYFKPLPNETEEQRKKRFNKWYLEEIKKMAKEDIIGNIHLVDSIGGSHQHLPAGQGELPLREAIEYLKKHGYQGFINSEAYGEERFGQGRILLETWRHFGSPIYSSAYAPLGRPSWTDIQHSYFGRTYPPYFIFGAYSPSNEWTLWSQVPME